MPESPQLIDRSWIDAPTTWRLIAAFDAAGLDFRFVGGAVRDALLGRTATDVDVATPATPDAVCHAASAAGLKTILTGLAHGTVTVLADGRHFEVTTLRRDVETDGRHAVVAFTDDWRIDASRRDFTLNALYADRDGRVTDFFGGIADAKAGRVRFIGDPSERISEDALRILRFFRFHAHYGQGPVDPAGLAACAEKAAMIDGLSGERVRDEILKLLRADRAPAVWQAMIDAGIVAHILPAAQQVVALWRMVELENRLGLEPDPIRRLGALLGTVDGRQVERLKARLKLSNDDAARLDTTVELSARTERIGKGAFGQALYGAKPDAVRDAALLSHVRSGSPDAAVLADFISFAAGWRDPVFPVGGADLAERGIAPGPAMGRLLDDVKSWWVALDFKPDRAACLGELDRLLSSMATSPGAEAT